MAEMQQHHSGVTHARYTPNSYKATYGVKSHDDDGSEAEEKRRDEAEVRAARKRIDAKLMTSPFKHVEGLEPSAASKDKTWFDIKPARMQMPLHRNLCANRRWLAMNWSASADSSSGVCLFPFGSEGRVAARQPCIRGHRFLNAFDLSPFQENLLVTAGDGVLRFWLLPEEGPTAFPGGKTLEAKDADFEVFTRSKISFLQFHPYVDNIVIVGASDFQGHVLQFVDVSTRSVALELLDQEVGFQAEVCDVSVSPNCNRVLVSTRDGFVHMLELHTKQSIRAFEPLESLRDTSVLWVDQTAKNQPLGLVAGTTKAQRRSLSLYNLFTGERLASHDVELGTALGMDFDASSGLLFLTLFGSTFIQVLRVHVKKQSGVSQLEFLNQFQSLEDVTGHVLLPKSLVDVRAVQVARSVKLTRSNIALVSWTVPRKRLQFFQDDLFPPAFSEEPRMSKEDFLSARWGPQGGCEAWRQRLVDLQPADMQKLSEAPEEELSEGQKKYQAYKSQQAAPKPVGVLGHKSSREVRDYFLAAQSTYSTKNRWDAPLIDGNEVDDDEWED